MEYFPVDLDIFQDKKVRRLIRRGGAGAMAVYVQLLCQVYGQGYYLTLDEDTIFLVSEQVGEIGDTSSDGRGNEQMVKDIILDCLAVGLFDKGMYDNGVLTSRGIQERYLKMMAMRTKRPTGDLVEEYNLLNKDEGEKTDICGEKVRKDGELRRRMPQKTEKSGENAEKSSPENINNKYNNINTTTQACACTCEGEKYGKPPAREEQERWYVDLANDQSFIEVAAMSNGISSETVSRLLGVFYAEITATKELHANESKFRYHAMRWISRHVEINNKKNQNGTSNTTNRAGGGAGSTYEERRAEVEDLIRDLSARPNPHAKAVQG